MGNCCGGSSGDEDKQHKDRAYSLKNSDGNYKTSAWQHEFVAKNWKEDTESIWNRPLSALSCHMDLPRLGHKIQIFKNDQLIPIQDTGNKLKYIQDILIILAQQAGESDDYINKIRNSFFEIVHEDGSGDSSQQLKRYLEENIQDDSKIYHILCLCHQKIVFPAYYSIKENIQNDLVFKDCRGSWSINILFYDDRCTVVHSKVQIAKDTMPNEDPEFSFRWELVINLTGSNYDHISGMDVRVAEVTTRNDVPKARSSSIQDAFKKFMD